METHVGDRPKPSSHQVRICQNRTCRKQGAEAVLQEFQAVHLPTWEIVPSACLGECGHGPMVLILPDRIWYDQVAPAEVAAVIQRHLIGGKPVQTMIYRRDYD